MPCQAFKVGRLQPVPISHLDAVRPALRQRAKKLIQRRDEVTAMLIIRFPEPREFEHEQPYLRPNRFAWAQEIGRKKFRVQKVLIPLSRLFAEPVEIRESLDSDGVSYFESEEEIVRDLMCHSLEVGP